MKAVASKPVCWLLPALLCLLSACTGTGVAEQHPSPTPAQFEYKAVNRRENRDVFVRLRYHKTETLNELAADGWELVTEDERGGYTFRRQNK